MQLTGKVMGNYEIGPLLGRGGMSEVYRARHTGLERDVAIKFLSMQLMESSVFLQRFQREARLMARLDHPNLARIYDFGADDGRPYLVIEYLEGENLQDRLERGPLGEDAALRIFSEALRGLGQAHNQGIAHRDIKPSNIFLCSNGAVKVVDFGIARGSDENRLTSAGTQIGTPEYMSPEHAEGLPTDARSDVYSLGILLYELLTGAAPFTGTTPLSVLNMHLTRQPAPLPASISPWLRDIVTRALSKSPDARFADANAMLAAVQARGSDRAAPTAAAIPATPPAAPVAGRVPQMDFGQFPATPTGGIARPSAAPVAPAPYTPPQPPPAQYVAPANVTPNPAPPTRNAPPPTRAEPPFAPIKSGSPAPAATPAKPAANGNKGLIIGLVIGAIVMVVVGLGVLGLIVSAAMQDDKTPDSPGVVQPSTNGSPSSTYGEGKVAPAALPDGWQQFAPSSGGYHIALPGTPTSKHDTNGMDTYTLDKGNIAYAIMDKNLDSADTASLGTDNKALQLILEGAVRAQISRMGGRVISNEDITQDGWPGKKMRMETPASGSTPAAIVLTRMFVTRSKIMGFFMFAKKDVDYASDSDTFFNSLWLAPPSE